MIKNTGKRCITFIALLALLVMTAACSRENGEGGTGRENGRTGNTAAGEDGNVSDETRRVTRQPEPTLKLELEPSGNAGKESEEDNGRESLPVLGDELLLVQLDTPYIETEDTVIGILQDRFSTEPEEKKVFERINAFLSAYKMSNVDKVSLDPQWAPIITQTLLYHINNGNIPGEYRIGKADIDDGSGRANIRLIGDRGRASGEIYLSRIESDWYVSDLQIDLNDLDRDYEPPENYEPGVYRWIDRY